MGIRRKKVLCPGCGEHYLHRTEEEICYYCKRDIELGRDQRKKMEAKREDKLGLRLGPAFMRYTFREFDYGAWAIEYIRRIVNEEDGAVGSNTHYLYQTAYTQSIDVVGTPEQIEAIESLCKLLDQYHEKVYNAGIEFGKSLLIGLAEGRYSPEEFFKR